MAVAFNPPIAMFVEYALPAGTPLVVAMHVTVFSVGVQVQCNVGVGGGTGVTRMRLSDPTYPVQFGIDAEHVSNFTCTQIHPPVLGTCVAG